MPEKSDGGPENGLANLLRPKRITTKVHVGRGQTIRWEIPVKTKFITLLALTWTTFALAQSPYAGIYGGTVDDTTYGDASAGVFTVFVGTNGQATVVGYDVDSFKHYTGQAGGIAAQFNVPANGNWNFSSNDTIYGVSGSGSIASGSYSGTLNFTNGDTVSLNGSQQSPLGSFQNAAGFYSGTFSGTFGGKPVSGTLIGVLFANGQITFSLFVNGALNDGGQGQFGSNNQFITTNATSGSVVAGTLTNATLKIGGTGSNSSGSLKWTVSRSNYVFGVATTNLPAGMATVPYSQTLTAYGGPTNYTWGIISGGLPAGLSLSSSGVISGTPTVAVTTNFTVRATNAVGLTATQALSLVVNTYSAQTYTLLHIFTGSRNDGANPLGSLTLSNGTFYGLTSQGGFGGVLFKMNQDGSGYTNLYNEFTGNGGNGLNPAATPTLSGTNLYGTTVVGGVNGVGVVFRENTNGTSYTNLHVFAGSPSDGSSPYGSLTLANGLLYGLTYTGGSNSDGVLFRLSTGGGNTYTNLHVFAGYPSEGAYPGGDLTLSDSNFYGMTYEGGAANLGVVFRVNTDGSSYTNLHSFAGYPGDGASPWGSLTLSGSNFYGMTLYGGSNNDGVVFMMNMDGSGYTNLHNFAVGAGDGMYPRGSLTLTNGALYGMTSAGGASNVGVVFRINTDGSSYTNLHVFAGYPSDGASPWGSLTLSGSTLYGMTEYGGTNNDGVVFALLNIPPVPPTSLTIIYTSNRAIVSWPSSVSGWTLQTNADLTTTNWGNYAGTIISNTATNSPTKGNLFFRLWYTASLVAWHAVVHALANDTLGDGEPINTVEDDWLFPDRHQMPADASVSRRYGCPGCWPVGNGACRNGWQDWATARRGHGLLSGKWV